MTSLALHNAQVFPIDIEDYLDRLLTPAPYVHYAGCVPFEVLVSAALL
jgi:hypothetical protein